MADKDKITLTAEDYEQALQDLGTYVDVTVDDLVQINQVAQKHAMLRQAERAVVRDIMTPGVTTVAPGTPLSEAAGKLLELRISGLPVLDSDNKLVGVVTEADFLSAMGIPCHHPAHSLWQTLENMFRYAPDTAAMPETVADIMNMNVVTITAEMAVHDAIDVMKKNHIKRLIVVDAQNQVIGILTRSSLIRLLLKNIL